MLIFQIKRIISTEKWCNYAVTFFFLKMPKIWVGRTTVDGEKNRGWPLIKKKKFAEITTELIIIIIIIITKLTIKSYLQLISLKKLFSQSTIPGVANGKIRDSPRRRDHS